MADGSIEYVYFPDSGIASIVAISPDGNKRRLVSSDRTIFLLFRRQSAPEPALMKFSCKVGYRSSYCDRCVPRGYGESPRLAHLLACYTQALGGRLTNIHHDGDAVDLLHPHLKSEDGVQGLRGK